LVNRATILFYKKEFDAATAELERTAKLKPNEPNIYNTLAMIFAEQGHHEEALKMVQKALALAPQQPYFINNRGYIYLQFNDLPKAEADINQSISLDPYNGWAYRNKGIFYLMKQDFASAERVLLQAEKIDDFIDKVYFYLGTALLKNGKKNEACAAFRKSEERGDKMMTVDLIKSCR
ncbi:MAG: tetratricopeptide repeat protein, partial [Cytophagales bacterium]